MPKPRPKKDAPTAPIRTEDRARGALLGLAVGDALGAVTKTLRLTAPPFPKMAAGPYKDMQGGGPYKLKPGQVTDDTQMATCLAASLLEHKAYKADDLAKRYRKWSELAFEVSPQIKESLALLAYRAQSAQTVGRAYWSHHARMPAGSDALGRGTILGVYFCNDTQVRIDASLADAAITHFDPRCQLASVYLNGAIAAAVQYTPQMTVPIMVGTAQVDLTRAAAQLGRAEPEFIREIQGAVSTLKEDIAAAESKDPQVYGPGLQMHKTPDFIRIAFRLALWELHHAPSFEAGLLDVMNRGGSSDTYGAITGALLGALYGESAIPGRWKERVLKALDTTPLNPWFKGYHPRQLFALLAPEK